MSGRKQKTERKKTKKKEEPQVFFEDVLLAFLRNVGQVIGGMKNRGGAQTLGHIATSICATEALDVARSSKDGRQGLQGHISAAAYAVVAAMQQGGAWNLPLKPAPAPEQPPESEEPPPEPPEEATK